MLLFYYVSSFSLSLSGTLCNGFIILFLSFYFPRSPFTLFEFYSTCYWKFSAPSSSPIRTPWKFFLRIFQQTAWSHHPYELTPIWCQWYKIKLKREDRDRWEFKTHLRVAMLKNVRFAIRSIELIVHKIDVDDIGVDRRLIWCKIDLISIRFLREIDVMKNFDCEFTLISGQFLDQFWINIDLVYSAEIRDEINFNLLQS